MRSLYSDVNLTALQPFYKREWFITTQIIVVPLGIALLFILLFQMVKAIAKLLSVLISRTILDMLDIQQAIISSPRNRLT